MASPMVMTPSSALLRSSAMRALHVATASAFSERLLISSAFAGAGRLSAPGVGRCLTATRGLREREQQRRDRAGEGEGREEDRQAEQGTLAGQGDIRGR
eukprot:823500-Rhodomonas_salina.1